MKTLFWHELRMLWREPRFWVPFLVPPVLLVVLQAILLHGLAPAQNPLQASLLLTVGAMLSTLSVALTADAFAGERERNTLELLLSLPISHRQIFLGKWFAVLPLPIMLAVVSQTLLWNLAGIDDWMVLLQSWVYAISACIWISGITLWTSVRSQTVRSAAQMNVLWVLGILASTQFIADAYLANPLLSGALLLSVLLFTAVLLHFGAKRFQ